MNRPSGPCRHKRRLHRRGAAVVALILAMLLMALIMVGLVLGGARDQDLTIRRLETVRAFYAAEAGANMAIRELMLNSDDDGDGNIGSISDDGNDANDPSLGGGQVKVVKTVSGSDTTLSSEGRSGEARRTIEAVLN